jgi:ClpX C4-type zinc finger protein
VVIEFDEEAPAIEFERYFEDGCTGARTESLMPLLPRLSSLWRNLFRRARKEQEFKWRKPEHAALQTGSRDGGSAEPRCSFCDKTASSDLTLIAGPSVFICNECVDVCVDIIVQDRDVSDVPPVGSSGVDGLLRKRARAPDGGRAHHRRRRPKYDTHAEARSLSSAENAITRDGSSVPHFAFGSTFRLPAAIVP